MELPEDPFTNDEIVFPEKKEKVKDKTRHIIKDGYEYKVQYNIKIEPLPRNCYECPFYQCTGYDEDYGNEYDCVLDRGESIRGIAVERPSHCPLIASSEIQHEPRPTQKQVDYATKIARELNINLPIIKTKQSYWDFINANEKRFKELQHKNKSFDCDYDNPFAGPYGTDIVDCYDFGINPWGDS